MQCYCIMPSSLDRVKSPICGPAGILEGGGVVASHSHGRIAGAGFLVFEVCRRLRELKLL